MTNGRSETIIHGCMWYIMSTGFLISTLQFCSRSCTQVHRSPLDIDAKRSSIKPSALNSVALYVNKIKPAHIVVTVKHKLHDWKTKSVLGWSRISD